MRRLLLPAAACAAGLLAAAALASSGAPPKAGKKCSRAGSTSGQLVCMRKGGRLIWVVKARPTTPSVPAQTTPAPAGPLPCAEQKPPVLQNIGVELGPYDAATESAGAFRFTRARLVEGSIFMPFGHIVRSSPSPKANPQPTFVLPLGTPVIAMMDGVVSQLAQLWSTPTLGDVSVMVSADGTRNSCYTVELEHVINPRVKAGESVRAGQVLAEVGPLSKEGNAGMGLVETGILYARDGRPHHLCPFAQLAPSVQTSVHGQLRGLMAAWESYRGDSSIYDESAWVDGVPGCLATDIAD